MKKTLFVLGLLLACVSCFAGDEQKKENDGFVWTLRMNADSVAEALDAAGNVIIPADRGYRFIQYIPEIKDKMISVMAGFNVGYTPDGTIVGACDMKQLVQRRGNDSSTGKNHQVCQLQRNRQMFLLSWFQEMPTL